MENTDKNLFHYLDVFIHHKWLFILPALLGICVGVFLAVSSPSYYRSTTVILVEQQQVPEAYVTATDRTPFNQRLSTITQQILSRSNLERIIADFNLYRAGATDGIVVGTLKRLGIAITSAPSKEDVLELFTKDIKVEIIGERRDAFSISYSGRDPYTTMQVTTTLASLFIEENLKVREQYAEGTSDFLANELENAKKELESQEKAVRAFKEKYMGGLPQQLDANLRTLDRLQLELQSVKNEIKNAEDRKMLLEAQLNQTGASTASPAGPFPAAQANPAALELDRLQHELAQLLSIYKETYPDVVITRKRIRELTEILAQSAQAKGGEAGEKKDPVIPQISDEVRNPELYYNLVSVKSRIKELRERDAKISKQISEIEKHVEQTPANEQKFADLRRDYDISIRNYQTLLEKKLNARLSENLEKRQKGERFRVLDPANLPEKPYKPNRLKLLLASFLAGAGVGAGLVLVTESINPAFRRQEDFADVLPQPVLATIPIFASRSGKRRGKS